MIYTQRPGFAIDMALALENVSRVYDSFSEHAHLSDKYLAASRSGLRRYSLLGETLRDMYLSHPLDSIALVDSLLLEIPPVEQPEMDPVEKAVLDSCLFFADALTTLYGKYVMLALQDSISFADTKRRLQQAYDYAQANYAETQRNIFIGGNATIFDIFKNWDTFIAGVKSDLELHFLPDQAIFSLIGWLVYVIIVLSILRISTSSLKTILAGLAAGVGFALKDLINNFFYGVQLMAGRIKVGDKISCDGVRGIVKRVSYQTTTIEDEDGSLIAFTNTDLFSKKFRNLNSGKNYELLKMPVSVRYGTDIARARDVILEALKPLMVKDKSGRDIVDPSFPVDVRFDNFGDSSINLIVALYSTVETHYTFPSSALEAIYNAFYENGIDIPFSQHDVYIKTPPEDERDRVKM